MSEQLPIQNLKSSVLKKPAIALAFFSFLGFIDATYLTVTHYLQIPLPCSLFNGCDFVTHSQYSTIFGIPVALIGSIYYLIVFLSSIGYLDTKKEFLIVLASNSTLVAFLASLIFVYLQVFVLKSICLYCMTSALICTILFLTSIYIFKSIVRINHQYN